VTSGERPINSLPTRAPIFFFESDLRQQEHGHDEDGEHDVVARQMAGLNERRADRQQENRQRTGERPVAAPAHQEHQQQQQAGKDPGNQAYLK
jgi:hypothetical protein